MQEKQVSWTWLSSGEEIALYDLLRPSGFKSSSTLGS